MSRPLCCPVQNLGLDGKWICDPCLEELELSRHNYTERRANEYEHEFMKACAVRIANQWRSHIMLNRFRKKRAAVRLLQARWRRQRCVHGFQDCLLVDASTTVREPDPVCYAFFPAWCGA